MAEPEVLAGAAPVVDGYPLVVRLQGRPVLVVGGGVIGLRKTEGLLASGATITAVSPVFAEGWAELADAHADRLTLVHRPYETSDLDAAWLVVAATNDAVVQQRIFDECEQRRVFCNAVDDPDRCAFILPAIERRGPVIVSVSTQGRSPTLAKHLRDLLASAMPEDIEALAERLAAERKAIQASGRSTEDIPWPNPLA